MKRMIAAALLPILLLMWPATAGAAELGASGGLPDVSPHLDAIGAEDLMDEVPDAARGLLEEQGLDKITPETILTMNPSELFGLIGDYLKETIRRPFLALASVVAVVILAAFLDGLRSTVSENSAISQVYGVTASLAICGAIATPVIGCITETAAAIRDCANFILSFLPVFTGVMTAGGQPVTASTYHIFLFWICQIISQVTATTLVPLLGIYLGLCLAGAAAPSLKLGSAAALLKSVVSWTLGLMMTVFVGLLTMQSIVSAGSDTVTVKAARFVIGSFVPVVGGALSDAFATAQGCLHLLKTTLGAYAIIVALFIFLPVLLRVLAWYLVINLSGVFSELLGLPQISALLKSVSATLGLLLSMTLCFALLFIISTALVLVVGQGVVA